MKKIIALLLALALMVSVAPAVFASTTTLTTTVPEATYTLTIPADTTIEYNALDTSIGYVSVEESSGFAVGKNLKVTIEYGPFVHIENPESTIPYKLWGDSTTDLSDTADETNHTGYYDNPLSSGASIIFKGMNSGSVKRLADSHVSDPNTSSDYIGDLGIIISSGDWGKAIGGEYTSTITFTAEVVQETD